MAPIGTIITKLKLDKTDISGPDDVVSGTVTLEYRSNTASSSTGAELFGPLRLNVVLDGLMRLQVAENRTSHAYIWFHERFPILQKRENVFDGPFRASASSPQYFRFSTQMREASRYARTRIVPPSFKTRFDAEAVRQAGKHQGAAAVEYSVRVEAEFPGIEVETSSDAPPSLIRYEQASVPPQGFHPEFTQLLQVQSYELLPESERPVSLLDTTKAVLKNVTRPVLAFNVTCSKIPVSTAVGENVRIEIRIKLDNQISTAVFVPDIVLGDCSLEVFSRTELYATNEKGMDSPHLDRISSICKLAMIDQSPNDPFGKSNDFSKTVVFAALPQDIPSSFSVGKLSRSYRGQLAVRFALASQVVSMKKKFLLRVLPPQPPTADGIVVAGPSSSVPVSEELPAYAETQTT